MQTALNSLGNLCLLWQFLPIKAAIFACFWLYYRLLLVFSLYKKLGTGSAMSYSPLLATKNPKTK